MKTIASQDVSPSNQDSTELNARSSDTNTAVSNSVAPFVSIPEMTGEQASQEIQLSAALALEHGKYLSAGFASVSPDMAEMWLVAHNKRNRPLSKTHAKLLAEEMVGDRWKVNGKTIIFDSNGDLVDGQHTLQAIVLSGLPQLLLVVRGVEPGAFDTIDVGRRRTAGDTLAILGEEDTSRLASALQFVGRYSEGRMSVKGVRYTITEIENLLEAHPDIRIAVKNAKAISKGLMPFSVLAGCYYLFRQKDPDLADRFFMNLAQGIGLDLGHPVLSLRERLIENMSSKSKLSADYIAALTIKAWNCVRHGIKVKYLRYREGGANPEKFPIVE